ncbi:hypothetical protein BJY52DRAFT_1414887 [Lactarius psammicola]|nr:hypothetical protein BJY52DRAFT_1414887 [Lactarius psammicola]
MTTTANFTSIPTLNYDLLPSPDTRAAFIQQLQNALINVGFLYLEHPPIPAALFDEVTAYLPRFFALPQERKDALRMANSPQFLGYSHPGVERTRGIADQREMEMVTGRPASPSTCICGVHPQWPEEERLPGFKTTSMRYLAAVESLSYEFTGLLAPDGLARCFDARERLQHRAKIVKYRTRDAVASEQGVGPTLTPVS